MLAGTPDRLPGCAPTCSTQGACSCAAASAWQAGPSRAFQRKSVASLGPSLVTDEPESFFGAAVNPEDGQFLSLGPLVSLTSHGGVGLAGLVQRLPLIHASRFKCLFFF